ncbi:hypothetical protein [Azobacteroides phage ProJPt-Bp1]|uniref:Uncharacterized protein n=1 Tax=Azobacteroides phage ProJPt-Bp1 TaxID=1920526 RepID=A0A1V1FIN1_9CAUD|nr:hypothetical protein KNT10_gp44 [Azobacteroides phage ProJPt-Bp1]BAX03419.1 hypothetical protein [Azobacteroides phage ProJPt-Bp1]
MANPNITAKLAGRDDNYEQFKDLKTLTDGKRLSYLLDDDYLISEQVHIDIDFGNTVVTLTPITEETVSPLCYKGFFESVTINGTALATFDDIDDKDAVIKLFKVAEY